MYVKAKRGRSDLPFEVPHGPDPGQMANCCHPIRTWAKSKFRVRGCSSSFQSAVGNMSSPDGWHPPATRIPFSSLITALISDGSFLIPVGLFPWVIYDAQAAHTECSFSQAWGFHAEAGPGCSGLSENLVSTAQPCVVWAHHFMSLSLSLTTGAWGVTYQTPRVFMRVQPCGVTVP